MMGILNIVGRTIASVLLAVVAACLIAWPIFATRMPSHIPYAAFLPSAGLLIVYSALAAVSFRWKEDSIVISIAATLVGLLLASVVGGLLIILIGCRFDACINL